MMISPEKRAIPTEIRAAGKRLVGHAATFGREALIGGDFRETIAPGAFSASLADNQDILALVDHDPSKLLARTRSGSLALSEDRQGLAFDIQVPDTQTGRDVLALARRGDLGGMSFGFTAIDEAIVGDARELRSVVLHEISVVMAWPAYEGTTVSARSKAENRKLLDHAQRVVKLLELNQ